MMMMMKKNMGLMMFGIMLLLLVSLVHSQNTDSCKANIDFNDIVNFDTTAMSCRVVWSSQSYILRYTQAGTYLWSFLLSAPYKNAWIGIGFSTNGEMIGSSAMIGWVYPNGTNMALQYHLKQKISDQVVPDEGDLVVENNTTKVFLQSNRIYLAFQLTTSHPRNKLLYAVGPTAILPQARSGYTLAQHQDEISTILDYATGASTKQSSPYTGLRRTHGALNMIGWGILIPIGAMIARYMRQWDPIWFYSHTAIQIFGYLFGLVAVILGFVLQGFINAKIDHHKNLGLAILVLATLQVMALLIRPQKGSKVRKYWNWYHHNAGRLLVILAISNIFYGIHLGMEGRSWYGTYAVIVAIFFILLVIFEIRLRRQS